MSTPGRKETNGIAERSVRTVLEGTRTNLEQAKMQTRWWSKAARAFCTNYNATKLDKNGKTPWELRYGTPCPIPLQPFGCLVDYIPDLEKAIQGANKFGPNSLKGISSVTLVIQEGSGPGTTW